MDTDNKLINYAENPALVSAVLDSLKAEYPDAGCALDYDTVFQLAVAVILSAQATDVSVNKVTPSLFARYPDAESMAGAETADVEELIRSIGLYKNKSANIIKMAAAVHKNFDGKIPGKYDELIKLPGVGRKTANVILSECFGAQRIAVDTHVFRVSNRIGLADAGDVLRTERQLMKLLPENRRSEAHHLLIFHGRRICKARKPMCAICPVANCCNAFAAGEV